MQNASLSPFQFFKKTFHILAIDVFPEEKFFVVMRMTFPFYETAATKDDPPARLNLSVVARTTALPVARSFN